MPLNTAAPAVWFPTVRTGTGTDVFTLRIVTNLHKRGVRAEITWLPLRAEYAPWTVPIPQPPAWATVAHVNTWLHIRLVPPSLPVVATIHHAVHHPDAGTYKGPLRAAYHGLWIAPNERRVLRQAHRVVAVSQFVADSAQHALLDVPMQVIHNGVDTKRFCPGIRKSQPGKPFNLLFVGSWMARKGVDLLTPILRQLGDGFVLHYTGGPAAQKDKAQMPPNMIDMGRLEDEAAVVEAMQSADALLFPSRSEGHPLVAVEAMACGLPIIGMHGSSLSEAVADGQTGLLCPQNDVAAFVTATRSLATDRTLHARLARNARLQAVEQFSEAKMIDAYLHLYRCAAAGAKDAL